MFEDLIDYEGLEEACSKMFGFSGVTFKRDFGPWKQGDQVDTIWFMLDTSKVEEQSNKGNIVKSCSFKLEAII